MVEWTLYKLFGNSTTELSVVGYAIYGYDNNYAEISNTVDLLIAIMVCSLIILH